MHGKNQWETLVRRLDASDGGAINPLEFELVPSSALRDGDLVLYAAGELIPANGKVVEGVASTAEDGMRVLSAWVAVRFNPRIQSPPV